MCIGTHVKYPLFLSEFNDTWIFLESFSKNAQKVNFMKIRPVVAELFRADRQTDMTKLTVALRKFEKAPRNIKYRTSICFNSLIYLYIYVTYFRSNFQLT